MKIVLFDKIYIKEDDLPYEHFSYLAEKFTASNPKYFFFKKSGYSTRNIQRNFELYEKKSGYYIFPIGGLSEIKKYLEWNTIPMEIIDKRVVGTSIDCTFDESVKLEDHQVNMVNVLMSNTNGLIQSPPGSGKTLTALNYISKLKLKTIVIIHEERLLQQWEQEIKKRLSGNFKLGQYSGAKKDFGDITLCLIQSSSKNISFEDKFKEYGVVIIDECHHSSSNSYIKFLNKMPSKYKYGLSGTLQRVDRMNFLNDFFIGPCLLEIDPLSVKNRITTFQVDFINTDVNFPIKYRHSYVDIDGKKVKQEIRDAYKLNYLELIKDLTGFGGSALYKEYSDDQVIEVGNLGLSGERNRVILHYIDKDIKNGYKPLVLTLRRYHALFLLKSLERLGYRGLIFISDTDEGMQVDFTKLRDSMDGIDFIIATEKIAAEGLDIPDLSSLHVTIPSKNKFKLKQMLGRIRRAKEGKKVPIVRDYVDNEDSCVDDKTDYFKISARVS